MNIEKAYNKFDEQHKKHVSWLFNQKKKETKY
jgi:hypothetical protein